jgi:hypothetical protein
MAANQAFQFLRYRFRSGWRSFGCNHKNSAADCFLKCPQARVIRVGIHNRASKAGGGAVFHPAAVNLKFALKRCAVLL